MEKGLDRIRSIKNAAEDDLLEIPGVTGIDVGRKWVGGVETDTLAIRVYVQEKISPERLGTGSMIPAEIRKTPTDVIERSFELHADTGVYDPLAGGISIGSCRQVNGRFSVGTLGCCVRDNVTGKVNMLSSFHTLAVDSSWSAGDPIVQPSRVDGGVCPDQVVALLQRASLTDATDCAIAEISSRKLPNNIVDIGSVKGAGGAAIGMKVWKRGRTTALTMGIVDTLDLTIRIKVGSGNLVFRNQIGIAAAPGYSARFGMPGDSGAVVVDPDRKAVGLYIGGSPDGIYGVANHMQKVLGVLNVRLCPQGPAKFKGEKIEKGEFKDKPEKWEVKEKPEPWEGKSKPEKREGREKGNPTPEELTKWEIDNWKRMTGKEPGKEYEHKVGDIGSWPAEPPAGDRIDKLEKEVSDLRHFIEKTLRPDLDRNALLDEPDFKKEPGRQKPPRDKRGKDS